MGITIYSISSEQSILLPQEDSDFTVTPQTADIVTKISLSGVIKSYGRRKSTTYSVSFSDVRPDRLREIREFLIENCTSKLQITGLVDKVIVGYITNNPIEISWDSVGEFGSLSLVIVGREIDAIS